MKISKWDLNNVRNYLENNKSKLSVYYTLNKK